ncbi:MAG: hypothetical protein QOD67_1021 [Caballeronia sp.]|jgi:hypothetical protein|nr:hypothetical protein [Caballeronia sp.]
MTAIATASGCTGIVVLTVGASVRNIEVPDATPELSLSVQLLGELEVRRNGVSVPLPASRRTRALLSIP